MSSASKRDRLEAEALLLLEKGEPLDPHIESSEDWRSSRQVYDALRQRLGAMPAESAPQGWQQEVWDSIAAREELAEADDGFSEPGQEAEQVVVEIASRRPAVRRWAAGGVLGGLAAAALLVLMLRPAPSPMVAFTSVLEPTSTREHRGGDARPGDTLRLRADLGAFEQAELRIYRDETELWLRCSDTPPCERRDDRLEASIVLDARGVYQPVLMLSPQPLPTGGSGLDADAGEAIAAGARVELAPVTTVR